MYLARYNNVASKVLHGRDRPIMLIFYLLCYAAVLIKFTYYAQYYAKEEELYLSIITICIQIFMNKSQLIVENVENCLLGCIYKTHCVFS